MRAFSSRRKHSQRKQSRPFGKLTIDTGVTNPGRTFPYESRLQELSFVSFEESKARKKAHAAGKDEQAVAGDSAALGQKRGTVHGHVRTGTLEIVEAVPEVHRVQDALKPPSNARVIGTRPSPLDLSQDISPSDRAITIGCVFSPSTISNCTRSPNSAITTSRLPPTIVITPAKDKFSPSDLLNGDSYQSGYRPASSVYSRYTNYTPRIADEKAPPVPPLPLFIDTSNKYGHGRASAGTTFEEDLTPGGSDSTGRSARISKPSTAGLPTPRRSKGWWNVITSPFSARSGHGSFWRSPSLHEERMPVLEQAEAMASSDPHAGVVFTVRAPEDQALRTAPAMVPQFNFSESSRPLPTRSETAPGALDANNHAVNIYRIPSQGEAAAYYDPSRKFPSVCLDAGAVSESPENDLGGWSPSNSVFMPGHGRDSLEGHRHDRHGQATIPRERTEMDSTSKDTSRNDSAQVKSMTTVHPQHGVNFSTPSEDELKSAGPFRAHNTRGLAQTTECSVLSPMSATPVVQNAHLARFVGPQSSFGEQKTVAVERTPNPAGPPLAAATMTHAQDYRGEWSILLSEKTATQVKHARENSYGLGISDGNRELESESSHVICEKQFRNTGHLEHPQVRRVEENRSPRPWYRRYFWLLVAAASVSLVLLIVLLAVFVPRKHNGAAVVAVWVNTTGFPALTVGILTVIQPNRSEIRSSCVTPSALWTCAVPDLQENTLPNFRLEIVSRNGTGEYSSTPSAPSEDDQLFLGQTTDNSTVPYNGEETPFYISLLDAAALQATPSSRKRDSDYTYPYPSSATTASNTSTSAPDSIPSPNVKPNGQPSEEVLYPLVTSQPLRLFNRGAETEHYGFYTYFDRSIYIDGVPSSSTINSTNIASNVELANASAVCTWSQTRFLVKIWTKKGVEKDIFTTTNNTAIAANSTANDMLAPGSFPYPVTFKLDRHGGSSDKKGVYCYGIDEDQHVIEDGKLWIEEDRAAGGSALVNPAQVPGGSSSGARKREDDVDGNEGSYGGIDGGDGGCSCQWQNW